MIFNRTHLVIGSSIVVAGLAGGCSSQNPMELAALDQPAVVTAKGAEASSEVTLYRQGSIDPNGSLVNLHVHDASLQMRSSTDDKVLVQALTLALDDSDMSATAAMPDGVKLRNQTLTLTSEVDATATQKEPDALTAHGHSSLVYHASLLLPDGTLYALGPVTSNAADFDVRATRYELGVHVTIDAGPQGQCWTIPGVIDVSDCSLYVETDGEAASVE
ncbi:MAG TPA: hypothetical protein VIA18_00315 [Polyangia bacterium]|nr:hypothetical protein [Polyangia bacterium]HWE26813.1 hypothetical protein [Polyangia bacterium]